MQKIKLQRQQRVITEMKLSKLLGETNEAENHVKEELSTVVKKGCLNSRTRAKCLQIAGNLKVNTDDTSTEMQAKGTTAPKFLIGMQARAMDREMKHQEVQRRREALEREKEALKLAAGEEKVILIENPFLKIELMLDHLSRFQFQSSNLMHFHLNRFEFMHRFSLLECIHKKKIYFSLQQRLDEEMKRERIKEYWRKRRIEKELEQKKAIERMKFLAKLEVAKTFGRTIQLKWAMKRFKNIVDWKHRNNNVGIALHQRILYRDHFQGWRNYTIQIWMERKAKADEFYNLHCMSIAWMHWQENYQILQNKQLLADDWFYLRLSERVFFAWNRVAAQTRLVFDIKMKKAEAHFNR